jgi:hypothetical protein
MSDQSVSGGLHGSMVAIINNKQQPSQRAHQVMRSIFDTLKPFTLEFKARSLFLLFLHRPIVMISTLTDPSNDLTIVKCNEADSGSRHSSSRASTGMVIARDSLYDKQLVSLIWSYIIDRDSLDYRAACIWMYHLRHCKSLDNDLHGPHAVAKAIGFLEGTDMNKAELSWNVFHGAYLNQFANYNAFRLKIQSDFIAFGYDHITLRTNITTQQLVWKQLHDAACKYDEEMKEINDPPLVKQYHTNMLTFLQS